LALLCSNIAIKIEWTSTSPIQTTGKVKKQPYTEDFLHTITIEIALFYLNSWTIKKSLHRIEAGKEDGFNHHSIKAICLGMEEYYSNPKFTKGKNFFDVTEKLLWEKKSIGKKKQRWPIFPKIC